MPSSGAAELLAQRGQRRREGGRGRWGFSAASLPITILLGLPACFSSRFSVLLPSFCRKSGRRGRDWPATLSACAATRATASHTPLATAQQSNALPHAVSQGRSNRLPHFVSSLQRAQVVTVEPFSPACHWEQVPPLSHCQRSQKETITTETPAVMLPLEVSLCERERREKCLLPPTGLGRSAFRPASSLPNAPSQKSLRPEKRSP